MKICENMQKIVGILLNKGRSPRKRTQTIFRLTFPLSQGIDFECIRSLFECTREDALQNAGRTASQKAWNG